MFGESGLAVFIAIQLSLLASLAVHDLVREKRIHATTALGSAGIIGITASASFLAETEWGETFVHAISFE